MDSLYGGRPGAPFVLKASFKTIEDMKQEFGKGPAYTGVWYNEYCIIDTENKDHCDNGKIYQRTPDYSNEMSGARYVGQIVGPKASSPELDLNSLDKLKDYKENTPLENGEVRTWVYGEDANSLSWYMDATDNATEKPDVYIKQLTVGDGLVSGKDKDSIDYAWITTRKANSSIAETKIGLQIPYQEIEFSAELVSPYGEKQVIEDVSEKDNNKRVHPFYYQWKLNIPEGKKGDSIRNIRIGIYKTREGEGPSDSVDGVPVKEIKNPSNDERYFYDDTDENSTEGVVGVAGGRYWLGDWYNYDKSEAGSKTTYCFGEAPKQKLSYDHFDGNASKNENLSWFNVSDTNSAGPQVIPVNEVVSLFANVGDGKDNQLYALYSSAESRANDKDETGYVKGSNLVGTPDKWANLNWKALGGIKDNSGLLIGHEIIPSYSGDLTADRVLKDLNNNYQFTKEENGSYSCLKDPSLTDGKLVFIKIGTTPYFYTWDYSESSSQAVGNTEGHWKLLGTLSSDALATGSVDIIDADKVPNDNSWHLVAQEYQLCDQPSCSNWWGTVYAVEEDSSSTLPDTGTGSTLYITNDGIYKWDSATNTYKSLSTTNAYVDAKVQELSDAIIALTTIEIDEANGETATTEEP